MTDIGKYVQKSKTPVSIRRAAKVLGVAYTTAKRYLEAAAKEHRLRKTYVREGKRGQLSAAWERP